MPTHKVLKSCGFGPLGRAGIAQIGFQCCADFAQLDYWLPGTSIFCPTESQIRKPKAEARKKSEARNPKMDFAEAEAKGWPYANGPGTNEPIAVL
jgi:hypothetical protein